MPAPATNSPTSPATAGGTVLLPATKFFVRRIPLVAGQDAAGQAALALEAIGPFAPGQLYHGHCASADGTQALVFAAYRRNFDATDTATWSEADAVLPDFALWLGQTVPAKPEVWLHERNGHVAAILWDGAGALPAGVIAREIGDQPSGAVGDELLQEARRRLDASSAPSRLFRGDPAAGPLDKEGLALTLGDRSAAFTPAQLRALDVRDKAELTGRVNRRQRDRRLWLVFAAAAAVLAVCIMGELGLLVSKGLLARSRTRLDANAGTVRQIQQSNDVIARMEQLAGQSLRPFEMLALLNAQRPATLEFVRASTAGPLQMEIEAQTGNAADPQAYEQALARAPQIEKVELRDFRTSGGRTTFLIVVTFRPGFAGAGGTP